MSQSPIIQPRARFKQSGLIPTGCDVVDATITDSNYGAAGTASVNFFVGPQAKPWWDPPDGQTSIEMELDLSIDGGQTFTNKFAGIVDRIRFDPLIGKLQIDCRDFSALMRDLGIQEAWLNNTAQQLLEIVILAAGLTPDVQLPANGMSGAFYTTQFKRLALIGKHKFSSAYDLARFITNSAGCDMWAEGKTIKVRKKQQGSVAQTVDYHGITTSTPYPVAPVWDLVLERDMLISKGVVVVVNSYDAAQRKNTTYFWSKLGGTKIRPSDKAAVDYTFSPIGLKADKLQAFAAQRYQEILLHARTVSFKQMGDLTLNPRQAILFAGTGTSWDGTLDIDQVVRTFSVSAGLTQAVTLRNHIYSDAGDAS